MSDAKSMHSSVFEIADGTEISLPSHVYSEDEQAVLIEAAGFTVSDVSHILISDLVGQKLSPKLVVSRGLDANVVTGFVAKRGRVT